jgi:hypothetical protein
MIHIHSDDAKVQRMMGKTRPVQRVILWKGIVMRRSLGGYLSVAVILSILIGGGGRFASAQDATPDFTGHPLVGAWHLDIALGDDDESGCPSQVLFTDDGGYIDADCEGFVLIGVWAPTGDRTATLTFTSVDESGGYRVRATIEVAADGQTFTATFTFEILLSVDGTGSGEYGPGTATGTRQVPEAPGEPEGSIEELFSEPERETPEATPNS